MTVADEAPPAASLPTPGVARRMAAFLYEGVLLFGVVFVAGYLYAALTQQRHALQGQNRTWFCGAHFGSGFHEDGLQAGLAVAEQLGGSLRPWNVANQSGRIHVLPHMQQPKPHQLEAAE